MGLLVDSCGGDGMAGLGSALKEPLGCLSPSSTVKSRFFSSAMVVAGYTERRRGIQKEGIQEGGSAEVHRATDG